MLDNTVAIENKNGLIAITRIILIASDIADSFKPGATIYRTSGSAKIIMKTEAIKQSNARKFKTLVLSSQADYLLPLAKRWLKTGIKVTAKAPEVIMKNKKSGTVKAAV